MKKSDISEADCDLIDLAVKEGLGATLWEPLAFLTGGLSEAKPFKILVKGACYVARITDPNDPFCNLSREYSAMQLGSKQGVAPKVFYAHPERGILLMQFIEKQSLRTIDFSDVNVAKELGHLVRQLHECSNFHKGDTVFDVVDGIYNLLRDDLKNHAMILSCMEIKMQVEKLLNNPADSRPSHGDINPNNLLFDGGRFLLIDWESASQQNLYFDLACTANFFFFYNDTVRDGLLDAYFDRPASKLEKAKYTVMQAFVSVYYGVICLYLSAREGAGSLPEDEIDTLPHYSQLLTMIGEGKLALRNGTVLQQLAFSSMKKALTASASEEFQVACRCLNQGRVD